MHSPLFQVRSLQVVSRDPAVAELARANLQVAPETSVFSYREAALERQLRHVPQVGEVHLERVWPDQLRVEIVPREPVAVVATPAGRWLVAADGIVVAASEGAESPPLPVLRGPLTGELQPGQQLEGTDARVVEQVAAATQGESLSSLTVDYGDEFDIRAHYDGVQGRLGELGNLGTHLSLFLQAVAKLRAENQNPAEVDLRDPARPTWRPAAAGRE
jgi:cell division protein FtsQ